jgi:hypothetical protein
MRPRRPFTPAVPVLWGLMLLCGGCTERGDEPHTANTAQRPDTDLSVLMGEIDTANRFQAAVIVTTNIPSQRWGSTQCSGVLVSSSVILTAGHCVCQRRRLHEPGQQEAILIDGSACATSARVKTLVYEPPSSGAETSRYIRTYSGKVRPHPALKVLLDSQGHVSSSKADLAVILLDTPIPPEMTPIPLGEADVAAPESLVAINSGADEALGMVSDHRHFTRHKVTRSAAGGSDRLRFSQPQRHLFRGDSGGPFLRESGQGFVLVGISAGSLGSEPALTGTYPYRAWVQDEIRQSAPASSSAPR